MKALCTSLPLIGLVGLLATLGGCGADAAGPYGAPTESRLLAPLAGRWVFDFEETLDAQKAGGATDEQVANLHKLYSDNPQLRKMHADMKIAGNEAVCSGRPASEYRFFAMHEHAGKVCGKAWHHEDRLDPGDMSKCYVRLQLDGDRLAFELRMQEVTDLNDPDLRANAPAEGDSATCDADHPAGSDWSDWTKFVFVRKP